MRTFSAALLLVCFILWILPLGYFIKPTQEKMACDGQRAMCMCSFAVHKSADKSMEAGIVLKAGPSTNKENPSSGGNYFDSAHPEIALNVHSASIFENPYLTYKNPFLPAAEYVPKF